MATVLSLPTLEALREHVHTVLCQHAQFDPAQTPLTQAVIVRSGRPCGLFLQAQGPRHGKIHAVWAGEEGRILFYDSMGHRFAETHLTDGPDPLKLGRTDL